MARDQAAAEELERLLSEGVPAEQAGAHAALVGLATAVREHTPLPVPDPAFKAALRDTLLQAPPPAPVTPTGWDRVASAARDLGTRIASSGNAIVATATTAGLIGGTGLVVASQDALPGETLRPLREATETVRLGLADGLVDRGLLQLQFATAHLQDLVANVGDLDLDEINSLLARIDELSLEGTANVLLGAIEQGAPELLIEAERFTSVTRARLEALLPDLPADALALARQTLDALDEFADRLDRAAVSPTITPGSGDDPSPVLPGTSDVPTEAPSTPDATDQPTDAPTDLPTDVTDLPTDVTDLPTDLTDLPTDVTDLPTDLPSDVTDLPSDVLGSDLTSDPSTEGTVLPLESELPSELLSPTSTPSLATSSDPVATLTDVIEDVLGG